LKCFIEPNANCCMIVDVGSPTIFVLRRKCTWSSKPILSFFRWRW
jgi:hypothetical protein